MAAKAKEKAKEKAVGTTFNPLSRKAEPDVNWTSGFVISHLWVRDEPKGVVSRIDHKLSIGNQTIASIALGRLAAHQGKDCGELGALDLTAFQ